MILEKEGPNDGLVSVASSKWGTYLGTLSHVNHLDLVGWVNTARYKWAEITGREIKFRPATFYLGIADMLAREVEGQGGGVPPASAQGAEERMVESLDAAGADVRDVRRDSDADARPPHRRSSPRRTSRGRHAARSPRLACDGRAAPTSPAAPHHIAGWAFGGEPRAYFAARGSRADLTE